MAEGIFKLARIYSSAYDDLIAYLEEYINGVNQHLDDADTHPDIWDSMIASIDLASCEMNIIHGDYGKLFSFTYYVPYEDFEEHYKLIVLEEYRGLTHKEIADFIIKRSEELFESERKFEIERLEKRLQYLKQNEESA